MDGRIGRVTERGRCLRTIFMQFVAMGVLYVTGHVRLALSAPKRKLPPARLTIHRQTFARAQREETLEVQPRSGILALFSPLLRLATDNGRAPHSDARHVEAVAREGGRHTPVHRVLDPEPLGLIQCSF